MKVTQQIGIKFRGKHPQRSKNSTKTPAAFIALVTIPANPVQARGNPGKLLNRDSLYFSSISRGATELKGKSHWARGLNVLKKGQFQKEAHLEIDSLLSSEKEGLSKAQIDLISEKSENILTPQISLQGKNLKSAQSEIKKKLGYPLGGPDSQWKGKRAPSGKISLQTTRIKDPEVFLKDEPLKETLFSSVNLKKPEKENDTKVQDIPFSGTISHSIKEPGVLHHPVVDRPSETPPPLIIKDLTLSTEHGHEINVKGLKDNTISLELKDRQLGKVSLKVEVKHQDVRAELFVDSVKALQKLSETVPELAINLSREGLNLQQFSLALGHGHRQMDHNEEVSRDGVPEGVPSRKISIEPLRHSGLVSIKA